MEIEYDGTDYAGWQYQPNKKTIQGEIEKALHKILGENIRIIGAGRTDAGVSAQSQIANFIASGKIPANLNTLRNSLNAVLPQDIYLKKIKKVADDFNARFSCQSKVYQYRIITNPSPLRKRFAWFVPYALNLLKMKEACRLFLKQKNYQEFCQVKNKDGQVQMKSLTVRKKTDRQDEIIIQIEANRFLYKMVRRIVGAVVDYSRGRITKDDIRNSFAGKKHHPITCAPAKGLVLLKVKY